MIFITIELSLLYSELSTLNFLVVIIIFSYIVNISPIKQQRKLSDNFLLLDRLLYYINLVSWNVRTFNAYVKILINFLLFISITYLFIVLNLTILYLFYTFRQNKQKISLQYSCIRLFINW